MSDLLRLGLAGLLLLLSGGSAFALEIPARTDRYVNDYADIIPAGEERRLEGELARFDRETSNQILVVTLASLDGLPVEEVTLAFAEKWKPGQKGRDNGVIVGVFPNDRQARIEVGYGLEPVITDALAAGILQNEMIPAFRQGTWAAGVSAGVAALMKAAVGEYSAPVRRDGNRQVGLGDVLWIAILLFGVFGWILVSVAQARHRSGFYGSSGYRRGGYMGGPWGGGGFGGRRGGGGFGGFGGGGGGFGGGGSSGSW